MAFGNAGPSVIFTSMDFHWAPNAAMPSAVSRSTTWAGGSCGASCGGDVGGSGWAETAIRDAVASTAPATSVARLLWPMVILPRCSTFIVSMSFRLLEAAGTPAWRHCGRRERGNEGARMGRLLAAHRNSAGIGGPLLGVARQRADQLRA